MAKTTHCAFCGKELTSGFFSGDACSLDVGGVALVDCCQECHDKYAKESKRVHKRFSVKIANYKKATKQKVDSKTLVDFFLRYLAEEKEQIARCGTGSSKANAGYFACEEDGTFAITEFELGADVSAKQMIKSGKKAMDTGEVRFNKDDITKLEYRTTMVGDSLSLFSTAFSFEVRLNDEKVFTYKPCITKMFFVGTGLFPHTQKKKAKEQCAAVMRIFQKAIGSNIPIVEVKKFN
jgi:hypothetical protein